MCMLILSVCCENFLCFLIIAIVVVDSWYSPNGKWKLFVEKQSEKEEKKPKALVSSMHHKNVPAAHPFSVQLILQCSLSCACTRWWRGKKQTALLICKSFCTSERKSMHIYFRGDKIFQEKEWDSFFFLSLTQTQRWENRPHTKHYVVAE